MFIDTASITVFAGDGGNGVNSFYRDKQVRGGHPDGGDGGNGGDIKIRVSTHVHTLIDFKYRRIFKAARGGHGSGKQQRGKNGATRTIDVPAGTLIYDKETKQLIADLVKDDDQITIAKGGEGGRGNRSHKDATDGQEGQRKDLFLELKLIADVGIIGFPNAGKSTLLTCISKATPRIAGFPFTTKNPVLGVVYYDEKVFKVAEIPGLIEGAHKGRGLGHKFLRHAERTRLFIHLLDLSRPTPEDVLSDYMKIKNELKFYSKALAHKPRILVGNKIDVKTAQDNLEAVKRKLHKDIYIISAMDRTGIDKLLKAIVESLNG